MTAAELLPPVPRPPHDPKFILLNARIGWRDLLLSQAVVRASDGALTLASLPGAAPSMTDPSGSFGGLVPPSNVAVAGDGSIYLLDFHSLVLKRFDPCCCRFDILPCFGGQGSAPRRLSSPAGMIVRGGNLYVCDTGNRRLQVLALRGFQLRAIWTPPASAQLANPWAPTDIEFNSAGRAFVSDADNQGVHEFHFSGRWIRFIGGLGVARALAADCEDRIYVRVDNETSVRVIQPDGTVTSASDPVTVAVRFPAIPFQVDTNGNLHLGPLCVPPSNAVFDLGGHFLTSPAPAPSLLFFSQGYYYSRPIDSGFYRCQWHRVVLRGELPKGTRVQVSAYTAETELPGDFIFDPQLPWETNQFATKMSDGEFDCLIANKGGRYLWLRLDLRGNGRRAPAFSEVRLDFPRISLRRYLPAVFGEEPSGADFTDRFLSIFDTTFRSIESIVDNQAQLFDPRSTPAATGRATGIDFLSWLGSWIGVTLDRHWTEARRREWLANAGRFFSMRGTREGLYRELLLFLGFEQKSCCCPKRAVLQSCTSKPANCAPPRPAPCWTPPPLILEHFQLRRWLFVGTGRLGGEAELWGRSIVNRSQVNETARTNVTQIIGTQDPYRDPFHVYAHRFSVFVPACFGTSDAARRSLVNLLESERPAHTVYQLEFVEPRFRIGFQSTIGFNSVVGKYPGGVRLMGDEPGTPVGPASVVSGPGPCTAPDFEIGRNSTIGSTTRLE